MIFVNLVILCVYEIYVEHLLNLKRKEYIVAGKKKGKFEFYKLFPFFL